MRFLILAIAVITMLAAAIWWRSGQEPFDWQLPAEMPLPNVPTDNPMTAAKVELGRWLFYDTRLSGNKTMACASCHVQALAFTDGRPRSIGATGEIHPRSSMSLVNIAYASRLTWANPLLDRLEDQALTPLLGDNPVEMGLGGKADEVSKLLKAEPNYKTLTKEAFSQDDDPYSLLNAIRAISAFVRTIVSFDSPYDRYLNGDDSALSDKAIRGMDLFFSERLECFHCHGGFNFTDSTTHANANIDRVGYHNTGLYNLDGEGAYPGDNTGLYDMTGERRDMGRFKAPSLRNVAVTSPYMHDGSVATLSDVIDHYERGGRLIEKGEHTGDGRLSPYKSEFVRGFELTSSEREDLVEFLEALTDTNVLVDPRFSNPFVN
ncbi:MAG: di-heme enzyme [Gammaproteobacteria bacterium]|nr:di-heme enzyme [Gammaproteobacteria bacterium]NNL51276.1 di-heme enzyme [Woeseiaceae bacterium]